MAYSAPVMSWLNHTQSHQSILQHRVQEREETHSPSAWSLVPKAKACCTLPDSQKPKPAEVVEWHHQLDGHEFEQDPGVGDGQESLVCCSPWGHRVGHD